MWCPAEGVDCRLAVAEDLDGDGGATDVEDDDVAGVELDCGKVVCVLLVPDHLEEGYAVIRLVHNC